MRRAPTSPDPYEALSERLDAEWEKWPASERPLFPPSPSIVPGPDEARPANATPLALALTAPARALLEPCSSEPARRREHTFKD